MLTALRVLLVPVFAWLYLNGYSVMGLAVYVIAALTDALDGYLARKWNQITDIGKFCDPLADKLMQLTMLICLVVTGKLAFWIPLALFLREVYQAVGAIYLLRHKRVVVPAQMCGKVSTVLFILGILCVYPWHQLAWLTLFGNGLLILALALALASSVIYTVGAVKAYGAAHCPEDC